MEEEMYGDRGGRMDLEGQREGRERGKKNGSIVAVPE